jgi:Fe2+ or Zn2+ uptake regulation protein
VAPSVRDRIVSAFRDRGIRSTAQRLAVMEFVATHPVHATADEVYRGQPAAPRPSRATVYNMDQHHHFVCDRCGGAEDIDRFGLPEAAQHGESCSLREHRKKR